MIASRSPATSLEKRSLTPSEFGRGMLSHRSVLVLQIKAHIDGAGERGNQQAGIPARGFDR